MAEELFAERLLPAYWIERLGCADNKRPLEDALTQIQRKIGPMDGRISCRAFHEPHPFCMLILTFDRDAPDDHTLRICIHPDRDPDFYIDSHLYDGGKLERIVKSCDRILIKFVRDNVQFVEQRNIDSHKRGKKRLARAK